ncbi:MAG: tRNA (N6-isopentenyl adenosine(37)-C2)-methylthiotransferase MiaB, partial [Desulfatiglandaceae bacterium]
MSKHFFITTMGCQMNEYDSDFLAQTLVRSGYRPVEDPSLADVILINTCTVRAKPEQKAYSLLGRMSAMKGGKPGVVLGVIGCLAQQQGSELIRRFPKLDFVIGPRALSKINDTIHRLKTAGGKVVATDLTAEPPQFVACQGYFHGRVSAYLSIMEGCNNFCSYCIVPFVRGREISRSPNAILLEAKNLISEGVKEITLLGQNVNSYRWKHGKRYYNFVDLLRALNGLDGLLRLRFTTSHPKDLSDALIRCFRDLDRLCPHIHLPFQAGSNSVLQRMRRNYTREGFIELTDKLRRVLPDIAITSDVMVGFPGELEKDFQMTLDLVKRVQFDALFSFKYSDRSGTFAEKMLPKVNEVDKSLRLLTLQTLQRQITLRKNRALEGRVLKVLVEGPSRRGGQLSGRTGSNKIVNFN